MVGSRQPSEVPMSFLGPWGNKGKRVVNKRARLSPTKNLIRGHRKLQ